MKITLATSILVGMMFVVVLYACTVGIDLTPDKTIAEPINYAEFCSAYTVYNKCNADSVCNWDSGDGKCGAK